MSLQEIIEAVERGVCPFTKKPYDCARCESKNFMTDWLNKGEHRRHFGLCITRPIQYGAQGWRDTLKYFEPCERKEAKKLLARLLELGVGQIPIGNCDREHFCFRSGCDGHKMEKVKEGL